MKAALFYGGHDIRVETLPDPEPGPGEVLIRVAAAGVCGSDLHGYRRGTTTPVVQPDTGGHELAGVIAAVGPGISRFQIGDRVGVEPLHLIGCGQCRWCRQGHNEACPERGQAGGRRRHSGGFAELDVAPEANCYPIPDDLSLAAASILDVYSCAVHAAHRVPAWPTDTVAVIGTGPIGLATIEVYRAAGARRIIACGRREAALRAAADLGAHETVDASQVDPIAGVRDLTEGQGADVVIEAVGGSGDTFSQAVQMLAPNGRLGVLGMFPGLQTLDTRQAMARQIQIAWINSYGLWRGVPEFGIALDMASAGRLHPESMITHRYPLADIQAGFAAADDKAASGATKVIIEP